MVEEATPTVIDEDAIQASTDEDVITEVANGYLQLMLPFFEEWGNASLEVNDNEDILAKSIAYQRLAILCYMMGGFFIRGAKKFSLDEATEIAREAVTGVVEETVKVKLAEITALAKSRTN